MLKVIAGSRNRVPVTFLVRAAAFFDCHFQAIVEVFVLSAFGDLRLIVEFDFIHQQARKTLGFAVHILILGRYGRSRSGLLRRRDRRDDFFHCHLLRFRYRAHCWTGLSSLGENRGGCGPGLSAGWGSEWTPTAGAS